MSSFTGINLTYVLIIIIIFKIKSHDIINTAKELRKCKKYGSLQHQNNVNKWNFKPTY